MSLLDATSAVRRVTVLAAVSFLGAAGPLEGQSWRTVTMSRQRTDDTPLDVTVGYHAGQLRIRPAGGGLLYRMHLRYDEAAARPVARYQGRSLRLGLEGMEGEGWRSAKREGGELSLELGRGLPMNLVLEFGAGRADLDLGGISLSGLKVKTGASESRLDVASPNPVAMRRATLEVGAAEFVGRNLGNLNADAIDVSAGVGAVTLEFTGEWQRHADVSVDMGLGSLELRFPEGLGVRLESNTFLASFDAEGMVKRGEAYYSPDWDRAAERVSVDIDAAFGSVTVVWLR
jgi:hypothetical protein